MQPVQAYNYFKYVNFLQRPSLMQSGVGVKYFLSWEDALWNILRSRDISQGKVLIPSFWCLDVINNIKTHGLSCEYYELDKYLQPVEANFYTKLKEVKPKVVVIFNACGMQNNLALDWPQVMAAIPTDTIVIWDCVHSVLNPAEANVKHDNLFIIDSWRKVLPLQGSACYSTKSAIAKLKKEPQENGYKLKVYLLFFAYQIFLWLQGLLTLIFTVIPMKIGIKSFQKHNKPSSTDSPPPRRAGLVRGISRAANCFGRQAEYFMMAGYDVIGKSLHGATANPIMVFLHKFIDFKKIQKIKDANCKAWAQKLQSEFAAGQMFPLCSDVEQYKNLRGYPVGLPATHAFAQIAEFRQSGILVRSELEGSPHTREYKVILLPIL